MDGVLCHYDFAARLNHMARLTGRRAEEIEAAIYTSGWDERSDRGEFGSDAYLRGCTERLGAPVRRADWIAARAGSITPKPRVLAIAGGLAGRAALGVFTNNNTLLAEALPEIFPQVREIFGPHVFVSGVLKRAKPDPAAFLDVLGRLGGIAPERALFIDDSPEYIAGAARAGLHTHLFGGAPALAEALAGFGLD